MLCGDGGLALPQGQPGGGEGNDEQADQDGIEASTRRIRACWR